MPLVKLSNSGVGIRRRRVLISGAPNTRKTTACLTFPKPIGILSFPGEKGYDTIPVDDPEIIPVIWQVDEGKKQDSHQVVKEIRDASGDFITGKHGPIQTFVGDGLHKFFEYIMDSVTDGAWFSGTEFEPKMYALAYREFTEYLSRVMHSRMPVVVFTTWDGSEADRPKKPGERAQDIPTHTWPELPGKMAKRIVGEFSVVVHQSLRPTKPGEPPAAFWQTRPQGEVMGCGLKGPAEIIKRIPTFIPATYPDLEAEWVKAERESKTP